MTLVDAIVDFVQRLGAIPREPTHRDRGHLVIRTVFSGVDENDWFIDFYCVDCDELGE